MAAGSTSVRQPAEQCPNCLTGLRPRDRFCAACGMRLERPDLRAGGHATPTPAVPLVAPAPPLPVPFAAAAPPAAAPRDRGVAAALVAVLLVAMISLTIALLVAVAGEDDDAPTLVTTPQVVTTP